MKQLGTAILFLCLLLAAASAQAEIPGLMIVWGDNDYQYFDSTTAQNLVEDLDYATIMDNSMKKQYAEFNYATDNYNDLDEATADKENLLWWFNDPTEYFSELTSDELSDLRSHIKSGGVVATGGDAEYLVNDLDAYADAYFTDLSAEREEHHIFISNVTEDGTREDFLYEISNGSSWGSALGTALLFAEEQFDEAALANASNTEGLSPWNSGRKSETFGTNFGTNSTQTTIDTYQLDTDNTYHDWYYVQMNTFSTVRSYHWNRNWLGVVLSCGWYTEYIQPKGTISSNATLIEFTPETDLSNRTVTNTIGAELGAEISDEAKGAGKVSASRSITYELKDVTVYNYSDPYNKEMKWKYVPKGPEIGWIINEEPAKVARSTAFFKTAFIVRVDKNQSFSMSFTPNVSWGYYRKKIGIPGYKNFFQHDVWKADSYNIKVNSINKK
jgi:hypothetical protein